MVQIPSLFGEVAELLALIAGFAAAVWLLASRRTAWRLALLRNRGGYGVILSAAVVLGAIVEDVIGNETSALDRVLLMRVHETVPAASVPAFHAITFTGSFAFISSVAALLGIAFWFWGLKRSAAALVVTPALAGTLIYVAKSSVGRARPALWPTEVYWGSSFPSGHTLAAAALATAAYLAARQFGARASVIVGIVGIAWVAAVALSRLVLGVHWPTDVAAAACAGVLAASASHAVAGWLYRPGQRCSTPDA